EDVVPQLEGLAEILQSERMLLHRRLAVEVRDATGREHAVVVVEARRVRERQLLGIEIDLHDFALSEADVRSAPEHLAERRRDLRRVQQAARDLIQEWREEV